MPRNQLFATKSLSLLLKEMTGAHRLRRVLGPVALSSLGVGAIIGAGIFVATGAAAREYAGPSLMVSYLVAGITCVFAALCYAEFASMAPVAGSAYTYAYTTLGELAAWIIGWDLILEYAVGAATVANGWSGYLQSVLANWGIVIPKAWCNGPIGYKSGLFHLTDSYINLPAIAIVTIITAVLIWGIQESAKLNAVMVFIKVTAIVFVILVGAFYINPANWRPFAPYGWTGISFFGMPICGQTNAGGEPLGMLAGTAIIFFAYIGFDAVSTHAEEAIRPQRDVPIAILASLLISTVLYVAVVAVLTGMVPSGSLSKEAGVADAFAQRGLPWAQFIVASAGVAGITSALLVMMLSAPRVILAMARDGLLPERFFADIHPRFLTPWKSTLVLGMAIGTMAGLLPLDALLHLANIGTLLAFVIVCAAVLVMRRTNPQATRPFRCPWSPVIPSLGIACCLLLMFSLPAANWWRLVIWLGLGLIVYFCYGYWHSHVRREREEIRKHGVSPAGMLDE